MFIMFNVYVSIFLCVYRLSKTAAIIQHNFRLFVSICEHEDMVTSIIDYLKYFSVQIIHMMNGMFNNILAKAIVKILILHFLHFYHNFLFLYL